MKLFLNETLLHNYFDPRYIKRGQDIVYDKAVVIKTMQPTYLNGYIMGTAVYVATLTFSTDIIQGECTCPAFEDFGPCKHMAALGIAGLLQEKNNYSPSKQAIEEANFFEEAIKNIEKLTKDELIKSIIDLSGHDPSILDYFRY